MILSAQSIRKRNLISPFRERTLHEPSGMTFGLSANGYDIRLDSEVTIGPQGFILASSIEEFFMPNDLAGIVHDKSTLARRGIAVQNTVLESGWRGFLTLEITNHSAQQFVLLAGSPIAQVVFHLLDEPTESPYEGKYQNQRKGPVQAIFETKAHPTK